jgi:membrane protease YdiL (CAAX protease family)
MDELEQLARSPAFQVLAAGSISVWLIVVARLCCGLRVLPFRSRRRVPWGGLEVLAVFLLYESPLLIGMLWRALSRHRSVPPGATAALKKVDTRHEVADLLLADSSLGTWLLCALVVVVVAPVVEEFLYRLLLQGWLEAAERRARRRIAGYRRLTPGAAPVLLVSLLFALRHFRMAAPPASPESLKAAMMSQIVLGGLTVAFGLWLLRARSGAAGADLGWVGQRVFADVRLGVLAACAVFAPITLVHLAAKAAIPAGVAADPIPLFFLAVALGTVYYRTHRILPAIVIHSAFNATSLALFWLQIQTSHAAASAGP